MPTATPPDNPQRPTDAEFLEAIQREDCVDGHAMRARHWACYALHEIVKESMSHPSPREQEKIARAVSMYLESGGQHS